MKFYNLIIKYRLWLGALCLLAGILVNITSSFWPAFPLYLLALIAVVTHFLFGPMRLIQEHMETGNLEGAQKVLDSIWFPNILIKPVRSVFYFLQSNLALFKQDYDTAEIMMKKSLSLGMPMKETEGAAYFQLGTIYMQKNNMKQAEEYIRKAIRAGLPDKENTAAGRFPFHVPDLYEQKRIQGGKGLLQKSERTKTYHSTGGGPNQTNRKVHQQDTWVI